MSDDRVLVPIEEGPQARAALDHALDVAIERGATVHLLNVADTNEPSLVRIEGSVVDVLEEEGTEVVEDARRVAAERGVSVTTAVRQGDPASVIAEYADGVGIDLIVMGTHARSRLESVFVGSTTTGVVRSSDRPVLAVREDANGSYPYEGVLVPTDGSAVATAAVETAARLARRHGATLHVLSVLDDSVIDHEAAGLTDALETSVAEIASEAAGTATDAGVESVTMAVEFGSVPETIREYAASEPVDLVVMGSHGRTGIREHVLGSTAERVLGSAPVPVLVVGDRDPDA